MKRFACENHYPESDSERIDGRSRPPPFPTPEANSMRKIHLCAIGVLLACAVAGSAQVTITEYPITTTPGSGLLGITRGADGNLWFTERFANKIGRITPAGVITEFPITTTPDSFPVYITSGPDRSLEFADA